MRVLVTGGAGFIGSHIVQKLLDRGHEPFVVDDLSTGKRENVPAGVPLFEVDICDGPSLAAVFESTAPDWVCHQAAQLSVSRSMRDPVIDARVNVIGLLQVLERSAANGVRKVVFASSGGVLYGDVTEPAGEETPPRPISPYGITKWVGEQYLQFFTRERGLKAVALRYANVYGPRQDPHGEAGVVAIFCQRMLAGEAATINGDGRYIRDYVYVQDVARANVLALEFDLPDPFTPMNIGTGLGTDVNQLAELIRTHVQQRWSAAGRNEIVPACRHGEPRTGDLRSNLVLSKRAETLMNWQPEVPLAEGIRDTVNWFAG
jgi:UDP-glucose 4-epimerase